MAERDETDADAPQALSHVFGTKYAPGVDLATNAESLGAQVLRTATIDEFRAALQQAREADGPVVVHVEVDRYAGVPRYEGWCLAVDRRFRATMAISALMASSLHFPALTPEPMSIKQNFHLTGPCSTAGAAEMRSNKREHR